MASKIVRMRDIRSNMVSERCNDRLPGLWDEHGAEGLCTVQMRRMQRVHSFVMVGVVICRIWSLMERFYHHVSQASHRTYGPNPLVSASL